MVRPALGAGRLLEPVSDRWPRGMIATERSVQNPAYRPTPLIDENADPLGRRFFVCIPEGEAAQRGLSLRSRA